MLDEYIAIVMIFAIVVIIGVGILALSYLIGPRRPEPSKASPYECGMPPVGDARLRFSVKFYVVAMLFLLFDIEVVFLYSWAIIFRSLGMFGFIEMLVFLAILFLGYIYALKKGGFEWD
ncbi:MAG: NADH-quinone oxidoreductase subunit A [Thermodesulfobacteriota bacterium]